MNIQEALYALGVRDDTLSVEEKQFLDEKGYLPLPNILSADQIQTMRARMEQVLAGEKDKTGSEFHQEPGTIRFANLVNKGPQFEICHTHPRVLAAIAHVLNNDMKLSSLNGRFAEPGHGLQALHADWRGAVAAGDYQVCNSIWLLDDFTTENGATRVVPGSQRSGQTPADAMSDPRAPHPDEILLTAPAGTVVIFNSHTWHGGTLNRTNDYRRAIHSYYCRRQHPQQTDQRHWVLPETLARLNDAAKYILDVHTGPYGQVKAAEAGSAVL
ncbi:MAG: phytanoyl-CoA dioxygenase family protein [Caldilineaceae bacterium]|nr:phytanoyl-CoA dioxygenase family protein [Caldilineaceae bacterium]